MGRPVPALKREALRTSSAVKMYRLELLPRERWFWPWRTPILPAFEGYTFVRHCLLLWDRFECLRESAG